jgi:probable nitrogen fixation protein FixT
MKLMIARRGGGVTAYVPKKDLEQEITAYERVDLWGGWIELANGWRFQLPALAGDTRLPVTVEARRLSGED